VDTLILAGVEADASVVKIAMDAFDRGFSVFAAIEFIDSTYGESGYDAGLFILKKVLGKDRLLNTKALEKLLRDS
jgi:nicotinamidase-related amidase